MRQIQFAGYGEPAEVVRCVEAPDPGPPGPGEVLVRVLAFPINPADLLTVRGAYADPPAPPASLGAEAAAEVLAVGPGVASAAAGDRVILLGRNSWSERHRLPERQVLKIEPPLDAAQLAMLKVNPGTAHWLLTRFAALERGDWVVQNGAASAVGRCVIQLARARGVRTLNIVRGPRARQALLDLGADAVLEEGPNLPSQAREVLGPNLPRLALDAVAGAAAAVLADLLADQGVVVTYGALSGEACRIRPDQLIFRSLQLKGFWLTRHVEGAEPAELAAVYAKLARHAAAGGLRLPVEAAYPMEAIAEAVAHADRPGRTGKVIVTV